MIRFEIGQVYYSVFTGESDLTRDYEVISRTEKMIFLKNMWSGEITKKKISTYDGEHEVVCPKQHEYMKPQYISKNFFQGVYLDPAVEF